jgi:hypothetical protein
MSHIYREGYTVADKLASLGLNSNGFIWYDVNPIDIFEAFNHNRLDLSLFRFSFSHLTLKKKLGMSTKA